MLVPHIFGPATDLPETMGKEVDLSQSHLPLFSASPAGAGSSGRFLVTLVITLRLFMFLDFGSYVLKNSVSDTQQDKLGWGAYLECVHYSVRKRKKLIFLVQACIFFIQCVITYLKF